MFNSTRTRPSHSNNAGEKLILFGIIGIYLLFLSACFVFVNHVSAGLYPKSVNNRAVLMESTVGRLEEGLLSQTARDPSSHVTERINELDEYVAPSLGSFGESDIDGLTNSLANSVDQQSPRSSSISSDNELIAPASPAYIKYHSQTPVDVEAKEAIVPEIPEAMTSSQRKHEFASELTQPLIPKAVESTVNKDAEAQKTTLSKIMRTGKRFATAAGDAFVQMHQAKIGHGIH